MSFFKDQNGYVYCCDDRTAIVIVFKYGKWKFSRESYYSLRSTSGVKEITEKEAKMLTEGSDIQEAMDRYAIESLTF